MACRIVVRLSSQQQVAARLPNVLLWSFEKGTANDAALIGTAGSGGTERRRIDRTCPMHNCMRTEEVAGDGVRPLRVVATLLTHACKGLRSGFALCAGRAPVCSPLCPSLRTDG